MDGSKVVGASLIVNVMFPPVTSTVARTKSGRFVNCGYVVFRTVSPIGSVTST